MQGDSASRLPPHHIRRPRLTEACAGQRVVVVEAAGGYGKSVLGAELVDAAGLVPIWVLLEEGGVSAELLAGRLNGALAVAGLHDAAAAMARAGDDPPGAIDAALSALAGESCAILIDDAHHAERGAAILIDRIAAQVAAPQMLVVLARHLPAGLERLRRAEALHLVGGDLALRPDETLALCRRGFGLDVSPDEAHVLDQATGGWTAAAVLAAARAKRTHRSLRSVAQTSAAPADAVEAILEEALSSLRLDPRLLAQLARLPLLDHELLAQMTGDQELFEHALGAGLPLTSTQNGWWELPGPVRDRLAQLAPPDQETLAPAARYYVSRGRLAIALQMLLGAGLALTAAALLDAADARAVGTLDILELLSVIDRIPAEVLDRFPHAVLHAARACHAAALLDRRAALIARLGELVGEDAPPDLKRALDAERAIDLVTDGNRAAEAEALARHLIETAPASEEQTRAIALSALGRAAYWHRDHEGRLLLGDLRTAADYLQQASDTFVRLGQPGSAAALTPYRAVWIEMGSGRPARALEILNQGLSLVVDQPSRLVYVLLFRAEVLIDLGRFDEAEADLREVLRIAAQLGDPDQTIAYVHWARAQSCSARGDAAGTLEAVREAERRAADWWNVAGADFLAEVADCFDRVGEAAMAAEYLERARLLPGDAEPLIAMAECALLARHGDPVLAEQKLSVVHRHGIPPSEQWRVSLFAAYAAFRRGAAEAGALAAQAFEEAARLEALPMVRERELTESLLGLAVQTGLPAARALEAAALPVAVAVLGRFELTHGGRPVELGGGQGAQLLKLVAVGGGALQAEQAIEALWPEVDPSAGRNRLRTVLGRLRDAAGEVVCREGELLTLAPGVRLDLAQFHDEARRALALKGGADLAAVAIARSAIARCRGPLLPHDPYAQWAEAPREAARQTMLGLLDLCAEAAADRGDLDEARRMVERTIELAPYEDDRYLKVAVILSDQGRKGAALSVLRRARSALAQIGIDPPEALSALEARLARGAQARNQPGATAIGV